MTRTIATNIVEKRSHAVAGALVGMTAAVLLAGGLSGCALVRDGSSRPGAASDVAASAGVTGDVDAADDADAADPASTAQSGAATAAAPEATGTTVEAAAIETHGSLGDFSAQTLQRTDFTQEDIAAKDVTVINFWSTTCPPCINEMPSIAALAERLPDNVQIITVCFDGLSNNERAQDIMRRAGYDDAVVLMWADNGLAVLANQVRYTPSTVFVAADGTLVGDMLVGVPTDLEAAYVAGINQALAWQGKPAVTLADAEG